MKNNTKKIKKAGIIASIVSGLLLVPLGVSAATEDTVINATIDSTISITTSGTVAITVTPVSGGAQSSASDSVSVSTNDSDGYTLTLQDSDADTDLLNGSDDIDAHSGSQASPTALTNNRWGYAVASVGGFDSSYSTLSNVTSSVSKWAGVPASGAPNTLKTTSSTASNDATTVWYSVKADTSNPNGVYTDTVLYTATAN